MKKELSVHIPLPYQKGNTITKKYTVQKIVNGTIYQSEVVDFECTDKKGTTTLKIGYVLRSWIIRTEYSHLTVSELNIMSVDDIIKHQMLMIDKFYDYEYLEFLSKYISNRINRLLSTKNY